MTLLTTDTALVTGASSGIGAATVRALRARGVAVLAAARRLDRLHELADETGCLAVKLDVRDREQVASIEHTYDVDILINNAGIGRAMHSLAKADFEDIERTIDTNVTAAIQMIRAVLPAMTAKKRGHIVNISSTAALYPTPFALYGASKGAIHKLSRDLRQELKGSGIRVSEINPGRVETEFYNVAIDDPEQREKAANPGITQLSAADVANAIVYVLDAPWHVSINQLEIVPSEQSYGGYQFTPIQ